MKESAKRERGAKGGSGRDRRNGKEGSWEVEKQSGKVKRDRREKEEDRGGSGKERRMGSGIWKLGKGLAARGCKGGTERREEGGVHSIAIAASHHTRKDNFESQIWGSEGLRRQIRRDMEEGTRPMVRGLERKREGGRRREREGGAGRQGER